MKERHMAQGSFRRLVIMLFLTLAAVAPVYPAVDAGGTRGEGPRPDVGTDAPPEPRTRIAPFLTFGAQIEIEYIFARNLDLTDATPDDISLLTPELQLALSFDPSPRLQAFVNLELSQEFALSAPQGEERRLSVGLKEAFVHLKDLGPGGLALQVGRQRFKDEREWLYDEDLDAVRAFWSPASFELQLSMSRLGLVREDFLDETSTGQTNNYLLYGRYRFGRAVAPAAYVFARDDRSPERNSPVFIGLQANGVLGETLAYWLEWAHVQGREGSRRIRGWGVDGGMTYTFNLPLRPALTVAYAVGSGDGDPGNRVDGSFRQTGLQENEARWGGVTRFKYYGEVLDPELSNITIITGGVGLRPTPQSSVDLVYHEYRQVTASTQVRAAALAADPNGLSRWLGRELDVVVGYGGVTGLELTAVLGAFLPGQAFPKADGSVFIRVKLEWKW
jgi:alginate production protein